MNKKILIITHNTSLSGAPKMLLLLWESIISKYPNIKVDVLSLSKDGGLVDRFKRISENFYNYNNYSNTSDISFFERIFQKIGIKNRKNLTPRQKLFLELEKNNYDLIFANTVVTIPISTFLLNKCPIIVNVHELDTVLNEYLPDIFDYESKISKFIVPSQINKECLLSRNIPEHKIEIIRDSSKLEFCQRNFHFDDQAVFRVLGCGAAYWRKGDDLFLQLASIVCKANSKFKFYWVGPQTEEKKRVNTADVKKLNLENNLFFIDEVEFNDLFPSMHLFALTSREDPFPLAAVEAGLFGLPIVCFDKATGISEVISEEMVSEYLNVNQMAEIVLTISADKKRYTDEQIKNKLNFQAFLPEQISNEIIELIKNVVE